MGGVQEVKICLKMTQKYHLQWSAISINGLLWYSKVPLWHGRYVGKSQVRRILKRSFFLAAGASEVKISHKNDPKITQKCQFLFFWTIYILLLQSEC